MPSYASPLSAIAAVIRGSSPPVTGITFSTSASPFYKYAPEPPVAFPYVVFGPIASQNVEHIEDTYGQSDILRVPFAVYGAQDVIEQCSSPWAPGGLFRFLDGLASNPGVFSGSQYECAGWQRLPGWTIDLEDIRSPDGFTRVYVAKAEYEMLINGV